MPSTSASDSPERRFQCQEPGCQRRFNRKYTLTEHMKTHSGVKPFVCPAETCRKRFSTSGNLARHKRLHPDLQPLMCPVPDCFHTSSNEFKLERHIRTHCGLATHACVVFGCGKTFSTPGNLSRHVKRQHPTILDSADHSGTYHVKGDQLGGHGVMPPVSAPPDPPPAPSGSLTPRTMSWGHAHLLPVPIPDDRELLDALRCLFDDDSETTGPS